MRIGINALFQARGGSLTNLAELLREWRAAGELRSREVVLFASAGTIERLGDAVQDDVTIVRPPELGESVWGRILVEQFWLSRRIGRENIDVLFSPGNTIPLFTRIPCVATLQNLGPFCEDALRYSDWQVRVRWMLLGLFIRLTARKATRLIFISRFFQNALRARVAFPLERSVTLYRARPSNGNVARTRKAFAEPPYVLCVSYLYPYKHFGELAEGFCIARAALRRPELRLVIAGGDPLQGYRARLDAELRRRGVPEDAVVFTGSLSRPEVLALLADAELFAFASTCEGGPTALIEALHFEIPIVCSDVGVMPEIVGDAARLFDPYDPRSIAREIEAVLSDPELRAELLAAARRQVQKFPAAREAALTTLGVIRDAANGRGAP